MNTRILAIFTTALSVALIVIMLWPGDEPATAPQDDNLWRTKVEQREAVIRDKDSIIAAITIKRGMDSLKHVSVVAGLQMREKALLRKLKEAEAKVPESAEFDRYVELVDSTNAVKDSLYAQAVGHRIALEALHATEMAALADKNVVTRQVSQLLETKVTDLTTQNGKLSRKLERKRTGNRILVGVSAGLAAAIAVLSLSN